MAERRGGDVVEVPAGSGGGAVGVTAGQRMGGRQTTGGVRQRVESGRRRAAGKVGRSQLQVGCNVAGKTDGIVSLTAELIEAGSRGTLRTWFVV